jgi:phosphatidylglycerophosphate synthase
MAPARTFVNAFSLARIGLALLFVLCFQRDSRMLFLCGALCLAAFGTDRLDGYLARRLKVASVEGRLWDSLGDKSFYAAAIIAFNSQGFLAPTLSWALIVREVALYITRILYIRNLPKIERTRPLTKLHGYCLCLTILLGLLRMYSEIHGLNLNVGPYMQVSACVALFGGLGSLVHYLRLG